MARRKSLIRLPFLKLKINKRTIFNIFGFIIFGSGLISLISFIKSFANEESGKMLYLIHQILISKFGGLSIFIPIILLLLSVHFFNTKKFRFIKPNITSGLIMVFVSLISIFQSGEVGSSIFKNLKLDFSVVGAVIIIGIILVIGLMLFLDMSIDAFLIFIFTILKSGLFFIKNYFLRTFFTKGNEKLAKQDNQFIVDSKIEEKMEKQINSPASVIIEKKDEITIKPLAQSTNSTWVYPPLSLLADVPQMEADRGDVNSNAKKIEETLDSFGIQARVSEVNRGPAITQYALRIAIGTKLTKITALSNDLALALAASTGMIRIEAPIPGRSLVGIEIPNKRPEIVTEKRLLSSPVFSSNDDPLLVPMGLDVSNEPVAVSIGKMPHVLIAGATGSGKSVLLNAWISTLLFRTKPDDLRMILVDPKRVELTPYNDIPHLLTPVITEPNKIISALKWTIDEMQNRYKIFSKIGSHNIDEYNKTTSEKKPYIVFIIDELATLMSFAPSDAEVLITQVAQLSRATGIHLVLATQSPRVNVITGLIKANIPARISFNVSSMIDSRVIIDMPGAEKLLGKGDMLFLPPDKAKPARIQGPYITPNEVKNLVNYLKLQTTEVHYTQEITEQAVNVKTAGGGSYAVNGGENDVYFNQAIEIIMQQDKASASLLQRRLSIGYARAARLLDQLEAAGYVSPAEGAKPRSVIRRQNTNTE